MEADCDALGPGQAGDLRFRRAAQGDEACLAQLRLDFMVAMGHTADPDGVLARHLAAYLGPALATGQLTAWLVEDTASGVIANGWIAYSAKPPHPQNPSGIEGYALNVYTQPGYRRRGIAREVMRLLIADARAHGAGVVKLVATADGRTVYEGLGFVADDGAMKVTLG